MSIPSDQPQRDRALDVKHSFLVHAPAGSGKTELLVQRYLVLLSQSPEPELIQAWTFTRKAADEMRERVLSILQAVAASKIPPQPFDQLTRWQLGKKLYAWQIARGWDLLANTHRLQIQTIDAFYAQLNARALGASSLTTAKQIVEDPTPLYQEAVQIVLTIEENATISESLFALHRHLNNNTIYIEQLLVHMLMHREQWINIIPQSAQDLLPLRLLLEKQLTTINKAAYKKAETAFSSCNILDWYAQLENLIRGYFTLEQPSFPLPDYVFWSKLADLLLTVKGEWRKTIPSQHLLHHEPLKKQQLKDDLQYWLTILKQSRHIRQALSEVRCLPPMQYTHAQWELLSHLFYILNTLVKILDMVFQKYQQVDYVAIALKARQLLGESEEPTQLLLKLDYEIQHILIDEFQDTSLSQLKFLTRLVEGWQPLDGRTLFLVGDPMQSIYRFRGAEPRLFKLVQQQGIASIQLTPLTLSTNFRANSKVVRWINRQFTAIQWQNSENNLFVPCIAHNALDNLSSSGVQTHWLLNASVDQEVQHIITLVKDAFTQSAKVLHAAPSVAILGRTRQHLLSILVQLREHHIPYRAIEIETLADKPILQDLLALTRALSHLADDVAWLAILRAPWCGIPLPDLYVLMQACQRHHPSRLIWQQLHYLSEMTLSQDSKIRLSRFIQALAPAIENSGRVTLSAQVMQAWYRLKGPATQPGYTWHPQDIDVFCQCVDESQHGEMIIDYASLEKKLSHLYATSSTDKTDNAVTLMTVHKAKGLEFDVVIVPSLNKSTRKDNHSLILLDEVVGVAPNHDLLLAPIQSSDTAEPDLLYQYLRYLQTQQEQAEILRLLYVACTRAKSQLHLLSALSTTKGVEGFIAKPNTFLHWLWPVLSSIDKQIVPKDTIARRQQDRRLRRMTIKTLEAVHSDHTSTLAILEREVK